MLWHTDFAATLAHTETCPKYIPEVQENEMIKSNRYDNEIPVQNNSQINVRDGLTFLLVGGGIGAVLALLFAPKSGREMRSEIADASRRNYDLTVEKANALKEQAFDRSAIAGRGLKYEKLDQLTVEILLGVR